MTEILSWIYQYVTEHLFADSSDESEYQENRDCAYTQYNKLMETLTPEQREHLHVFQDMTSITASIECEAIFLAALKIGLALGALNHP